MKKFLLLAAAVVAFSSLAFATTCASEIGTVTSSLTSCTISGFTGTALTGETVTFSFSNGNGTLTLGAVDFNAALGIAGLQFTDGNGTSSYSGFGDTATLSPTTGCQTNYNCSLDGVYEQGSFTQLSNSNGLLTITATGASTQMLTPAASTYGPASVGNQTAIAFGSSYDGNNALANEETDVYLLATYQNPVPEPTTFVLMGAGLGLVGLLRSRAARK